MKPIVIAVIVIILLITAEIITFQAFMGKAQEVKIAQGNVKAYTDELVTTKDKLGRETSQKYILQSSIKNIVLGNASEVNDLKTVMKEQDLKLKNLLSYSNIVTKIDTFLKVVRTSKDSVYVFTFNPEFVVKVGIESDSAWCNPTLTNKQLLIFSDKRETILPPKQFFLWRWLQKRHIVVKAVVRNSNPAVKTTSLNSTYIIKK